MANPETLEQFSKPEVIDLLVQGFNKKSKNHISAQENAILKANPALAESVFNGGLSEIIAAGKTNVTELSKANPQTIGILRFFSVHNAAIDGAVSVQQIDKCADKDQLYKAAAIGGFNSKKPEGKENTQKFADQLGLNEKESAALQQSFDKSAEKFEHMKKNSRPEHKSPQYQAQGVKSLQV